MNERLDNSSKNVILGILPEAWNFYYARSVLIIYQELPALELIRMVLNENHLEGKKEIFYHDHRFFCGFVSKSLCHWQSETMHLIISQGFLKGFETNFIVYCQNYEQACKIMTILKKKSSSMYVH